jgi:hypothetical protein
MGLAAQDATIPNGAHHGVVEWLAGFVIETLSLNSGNNAKLGLDPKDHAFGFRSGQAAVTTKLSESISNVQPRTDVHIRRKYTRSES